jgi:hypothetical protein
MLAEINWGAPLILMLFFGLVLVWLWALVSCLRRDDFSTRERVAWTLVILFGSYFGLLAYFIFCRRGKRPLTGRYAKALDPVTGKPFV